MDDIKGVPGIGPKGAIALALKYGSVENLVLQRDTIEDSTKRDLYFSNILVCLFSYF